MTRLLLALAAGMFAVGTDSFVVAGVLPQISRSLHIQPATAGQLVTAYALAYAAMAPVLAAVTGRWHRRRILLTGLVVFMAGNVLTASHLQFVPALVGRIVAGLGAAVFAPAAVAAAAGHASTERRGWAIAVVMSGMSAATAIGVPVGTAVGEAAGWRATLLLVTLLAAAAAGGVALWVPHGLRQPRVGLRDRLAPAMDLRVSLVLGTTLLVFGALYLVNTYVSVVFAPVVGEHAGALASLLLVWGVSAVVGSLTGGWLTDAVGARPIIVVGITVVAVDFALLPWSAQHMGTAVLAMAAWGVCGWAVVAPNTARLVGIAPQHASLLGALNSSMLYFGAAAAGATGAVVLDSSGASYLGPAAAGVLVGGLVLAEAAHRAALRAQAKPCAHALHEGDDVMSQKQCP